MTVVIIVFGAYYLLLLLLLAGWHKVRTSDFPEHHAHFRITVVVAFRNETENISFLIRNLVEQTYNHQFIEVLLCNDHSTDDSADRAAAAIAGLSNFHVVQSPGEGKKAALTCGIRQASGDIIVTTDADCAVPENWLARINHGFQDPSVKMLFGGVAIRKADDFFSKLQAMEFVSLVGSAAAAAGWNRPLLCNGANLAFLRSAFQQVEGYDGNLAIPSGDDEFLMRKILHRWNGGIRFLNTEDSVVGTAPQPTLKNFISQRIRWAGKWRYNASFAAKAVAVLVLAVQLFFIGLVVTAAADRSITATAIALIGTKLFLEFMFLFRCCSFLRVRWRTFDFLLLQFLYPFYVVGVGILSQFTGYEWKGRKWDHKNAS